ncbi:MAG: Uma2 family endonuclease [Pseudomonadota bacterium]
MAETAKTRASYEDLYGIDENAVGQIIDGELIVSPRPSRRHAFAASVLNAEVTSSHHLGGSRGPGGWIILFEPEIKMGEDILVPDLAGWKEDRLPWDEETNWISVPPDWVCEIVSESSIRVDRIKKMAIYAREGVPYYWVIDPRYRTLEVFRLESGRWLLLGTFADDDKVRAEPFEEVEIDLGRLWRGRREESKAGTRQE